MNRIVRWFRGGPGPEDGSIGLFFGAMLWWRTWATILLLAIPIGVGLLVLTKSNGYYAVMATVFASSLVYPKMMMVNPKYEITKNY